MAKIKTYNRILLKLSGETLAGKDGSIDPKSVATAAAQIGAVVKSGVQVALVIGGGNIFRGLPASRKGGIQRATADAIGMLATIMNALAMRDGLEAAGVPAEVLAAIPLAGVAEGFDRRTAIRHLEAGRVVLLAGGTGHPYFTTDTTAALRACEIGADAVLKATKVDGVYTADPKKDKSARRYRQLSYDDALGGRLEVMDAAAFSLCRDNSVRIIVFDFFQKDALKKAACGDLAIGTVIGDLPTQLA